MHDDSLQETEDARKTLVVSRPFQRSPPGRPKAAA